MDAVSYKTVSQRKEDIQKEWLLVDAKDQVLGRFASQVAYLLKGKHKPSYTPHNDDGAHVVVINADQVRVTGLKETTKKYIRHTGYPGGQREQSFEELMAKNPTSAVEKAVKGMLPRTKLGRQQFRSLHVFAGTEHTHGGQEPKEFNINSIK